MAFPRVVVIGASAGGVRPLEELVAGLAPGFPVPVLIVLHLSATHRSLLPQILLKAGPLHAVPAADGATLVPGRIYVAIADHHLLIHDGHVRVSKGPKENHFRPAVDVLFRSAAYHFGAGAIGVVMSGSLADGSSGLYAIKRLGGTAIIQDPEEAPYSSMPLSALRRVDVDHVLPATSIGLLLNDLACAPTGPEPGDALDYRRAIKVELDVAAADSAYERGIMEYAEPSAYSCPDCHGVLFRIREGNAHRFRCHTGHAYTTAALIEQCTESIEETLWQAVKTLQETSALLKEAATVVEQNGHGTAAEELLDKAAQIEQRLDGLRAMALEQAGARGDATDRPA